jgi:UDP-glucose 4-epimerase
MKVLVLGGAGFVGANMVRKSLQQEGAEVTVMDTLEPHLHATTDNLMEVWDRINFVRGDLRNEMQLADIVQGQDIIFNCAAQTSHPLSIQYPLLDAEINCLGNLKLLESLRLMNSKATVVYPSSSTVIGKALDTVVDEEHHEKPLEIYSANKGVAEKYYRIYHTLHGLNTVVLRFANLYGPYGKGFPEFGFINYFIHQALNDQEIRIFGNGQQIRNTLYIDDATDILWRAAHHPNLAGHSWLATGDQHLSVAEIAETIVRVFGGGRVVYVDWPEKRKKIEIEHVRFSSKRLRAMTKWSPQVKFEEGLLRIKALLSGDGNQEQP